MTRSSLAILFALALACGPTPDAETPPDPADDSTQVQRHDHHLHLQSEAAARMLDRAQQVVAEMSEEETPPAEPAEVTTAEDAIAALDAAGLSGGAALSNAYMFGMPEIVSEDTAAEAAAVRAENEWVAAQAAQFPDRLVAL